MGTSGPGVYQNDHAHSVFGDETDHFEKQFEKALYRPNVGLEDIEGPLAYVKMLAVLAEHSTSVSLEMDKLNRWKARYLEIYDAEIDENSSNPEYKAARRKVIEETFDHLADYIYSDVPPRKPCANVEKRVPIPATCTLKVTRAVPAKKMETYAKEAEKAGAKRGPKKKVAKKIKNT